MGKLFNLPKRKDEDMFAVIKRATEYVAPKITLQSTSLADRIKFVQDNITKHEHLLLDTDEKFLNYIEEIKNDPVVALDTETNGLSFKDQQQLVGLCIMGSNNVPAYVPVGHIDNITEELEENQVSKECLKEGLNRLFKRKHKFVYHHYYYDAVVLYFVLGYIPPVDFDTMVASHLLNENESHNLKDLFIKYIMNGNEEVDKFAEVFGNTPFCYIPSDLGANYAAYDTYMTMKLYEFQLPYLTKGTEDCKDYELKKIVDLFYEVEIPLLPILADMKIRGIEFDFKRAKELHEKYTQLKDEAEKKLNSLIPEPINYNSPKQVAELLYDKLNLPEVDGRKTDEATLSKIDSAVTKAILEVKTYDKLLGSFIDKLTKQAQEDGKIHCNLNSCGTKTGRLSSSEPNNQQIPSQYGEIRNMFCAGGDKVLISCDYSKQEIVVAAFTSEDENLKEAFHKNLDVYSHIASLAFKKPYEDCLEHCPDGTVNKEGKKRRKAAKAVTLGLLYSKGVKATAEDLGITYQEAEAIVNDVFTAFPKLAEEIKKTEKEVVAKGMVNSISGRRRRLPNAQLPEYEFPTKDKYEIAKLKAGIKRCRNYYELQTYLSRNGIKSNRGFIAKALRQSFNSRIQGEASVIMKRAMVGVAMNEELKKLGCVMRLSIHDELLVTCPKENAKRVSELVVKEMIEAGGVCKELLKCDVEVMENWKG